MFPDPKEDKYNPLVIGILLLLIGLAFTIMGGKTLVDISSTYYLNGQSTEGVVKSFKRNSWPRFRTFDYELEYRDQQNNLLVSHSTAVGGSLTGDTVNLIYSKKDNSEVYFSNNFLAASSYSFGGVGLGLFILIFGMTRLTIYFQTKRPKTDSSEDNPKETTLTTPTPIKIVQNILILASMASIVIYLIGGGGSGN